MPVVLVLEWQRQEDCFKLRLAWAAYEYQNNQGYIVRLCL